MVSILTYFLSMVRYGPLSQHARPLFGVSLYQPRNLELRVEGRVPFDPRIMFAISDIPDFRTPYLFQVPCSWGAIYFPEHFREFHDYLALRLSEATHNITETIVPDIRSNRWTRSWKKYLNELVYLRGYVMLYPNYDLSLATNHVEIGVHVKGNPQDVPETVRRQYDVPLMPLPSFSRETRAPGLLELPGESLPAWDDLPVLDFWGTITSHEEITRRGHDRHQLLSGCLLPLTQFSYDARELLCPRT
ncbi:hypothetical protein JB92DRAFT_3048112 [Gautieria morchelliformis]|nr:hypothetical protein JB92DRAFT_3048112 [Gautieria morchelliformis]